MAGTDPGVDDNFDFRRANTIDQLRAFVTSYAKPEGGKTSTTGSSKSAVTQHVFEKSKTCT